MDNEARQATHADGFMMGEAHTWLALFLAAPLPIACTIWIVVMGPAVALPSGILASLAIPLALRGLRILKQRSGHGSVHHFLAAALAYSIALAVLAIMVAVYVTF